MTRIELELIEIQLERRESFKDPNTGRYDDFVDYFWEHAASGCGVDVFRYGTMVSVFTVIEADKVLFPSLSSVAQISVWEEAFDKPIRFETRNKTQACLVCHEPLSEHLWHLETIICPDGYEIVDIRQF